jgi:radical SAM superfamily enzyme YgiQ (UPF0313 family)
MNTERRRVLLVQLPIPPPGPQPVRANVPLAVAYLKLLARKRGLEDDYQIEILEPRLANTQGDQGLVEEILARQPWMVGFTCYLWNIDRTLWVIERLKHRRADLRVVIGGPEVTGDNGWVMERLGTMAAGGDHGAGSREPLHYAVLGEGEQTFVELLAALRARPAPAEAIDGLCVLPGGPPPGVRRPLARLDEISSPYLEGILDAADEQMMLLETARGCVFRCKFCYYPKSYTSVYFASEEKILANLQHARQRGAREVVLLDPTLNQRRDFVDLLGLLIRGNPQRQFTYSGELRAEGITPQTSRLLAEANFTEVEIGLQSIEPQAQQRMDRKVNLKAFQRGTQAMIEAGIKVRVDLIIGLPGDTVESVRRGIDYLHATQAYSEVQVFNLAILPGTDFRQEAAGLGLRYQTRPPYYVLGTPTLALDEMVMLMSEAQETFDTEFDPLPPPTLALPAEHDGLSAGAAIDLDGGPYRLPPAARRAQAFTLWLRSAAFDARVKELAELVAGVLADNPHTTLQTILEPTAAPDRLSEEVLAAALEASFRSNSYLDRYYSLHPRRLLGAKRLVVLMPLAERDRLGPSWIEMVGRYATLVWRGGSLAEEELEDHEFAVP